MSILRFRGQYAFLSNFYACRVVWEGIAYPTLEHAYQAAKCKDLKDRELIRKIEGPGNAKRHVKQLKQQGRTRSDWDTVKVDIMRELLKNKFLDPVLGMKLLGTGNQELIEVNNWNDQFWGMCGGAGENMLGKLLMEIRTEMHQQRRFQNEYKKLYFGGQNKEVFQ